jgi:hypothetical protein
MKNVLIALVVLALAVPAIAGQNPNVGIYLYTTSTGIGGANWKASPVPASNTSVYVCFDQFGVGGGLYGASWQFIETPGPDFLSTTNQYAGVGGLTIGTPGLAPGVAMTVGAVPVYPNANGIIVLARIRYETPEMASRGGSIQIVPHGSDGRAVADANNNLDFWCVHSVAYPLEFGQTYGLSGHFGWDAPPVIDGDCTPPSPVQSATWGSIKALYR